MCTSNNNKQQHIIQIFEICSLYWIITHNILKYLKDSVWTFYHKKLTIHNISTNWMTPFWPIVHRCKKCSDISEVTSGGRAELKMWKMTGWHVHLCQHMLLLKCHCTFYIYGTLGRESFCFISWITALNVQKLQIFAIFAPYLASIVNWGKINWVCTEICNKNYSNWSSMAKYGQGHMGRGCESHLDRHQS